MPKASGHVNEWLGSSLFHSTLKRTTVKKLKYSFFSYKPVSAKNSVLWLVYSVSAVIIFVGFLLCFGFGVCVHVCVCACMHVCVCTQFCFVLFF